MPAVTVATNQGNVPIIAAKPTRTVLVLQNNHATAVVRFRLYGAVSLTESALSGLIIQPKGGSVTITGPAAQMPLYAITTAGANHSLDYESD